MTRLFFLGANLTRLFFLGVDLTRVFFLGVDLTRLFFLGADLTRLFFLGVDLTRLFCLGVDLTRVFYLGGQFDWGPFGKGPICLWFKYTQSTFEQLKTQLQNMKILKMKLFPFNMVEQYLRSLKTS